MTTPTQPPEELITVPKQTIVDVIETLDALPCVFWACEGPDKPVYMKTCSKCWQVYHLREAIEGK